MSSMLAEDTEPQAGEIVYSTPHMEKVAERGVGDITRLFCRTAVSFGAL